ncbi:MAG: N-6 DNA methylase [Thermoguttaceae bacterium]
MTIKTLVQGFGENIRQLKAPQYKESQVRLHYIDPFWKLLGWDVSNEDQLAPQDVEVMVEPSMDSAEDDGLRSREPDYLFRVNGFPRFIVEAKKPAVDIDTDKRAIFQAKRYAWSAAIPFAVLTDFEKFRVYDTTLKPILNEPQRGLVREFAIDFQDYPAKWHELLATFGRAAVADGSLEKLRARIRKISPNRRLRTVDRMLFELRGDEPVDKVFLGYLETYRKHLARAIYHDNKKDFPEADTLHGAARLTEAVQRLIDRLVFMRVCEDRGIREYGSLKKMLDRISAEGGEFYPALCAEFRELDREYNGYLYKYHFSESLAVSDDILADFIRTLYPPDGPWDFSAIGDDILGIVYEKFLGNIVVVKHGEADVEQKPEVRHASGVYYTPRFVVDTIIRRVVGPQIAGRSPSDVLDVKILDPACGSGSFLVATFQYLIDHCLTAIAKNPSFARAPAAPKTRKKTRAIAFKDKKGQWQLAPDFKASLLTNCLHGVDIDQQAVEVTVMSLYLKMLEGKLPPNWQRDWLENELLPSLDNNILCGNSLINSADFDRWVIATRGGLFPADDDVRFRMNRFDWESRTRGFGWFLDSEAEQNHGRKGFDCIIGNPPYIRVQELNQWAADECAFYKWRFKSAAKGNYDIYVVFVERCLELLAPDGLLGFIMPHKFWQARYGEGLRKIIADGKHLRSIIDFAHQQVFQGATTYTAIHVCGKSPGPEMLDYARFDDLHDGVAQCSLIDADRRKTVAGVSRRKARQPPRGSSPFQFADAAREIDAKPLSSFARLAQGFKTGADKVFVVELIEAHDKSAIVRSEATGNTHEVEAASLRPLVKSEHMKAYCVLPTALRLVFPYTRKEGTWRLLNPKEMEVAFPKLWRGYLVPLRGELAKREDGRWDGDKFYRYSRPQNFEPLSQPKIMNPDICEHPQMCWDASGEFVFSGGAAGGVAILPSPRISSALLMGILNSKFADDWIRQNGTPYRGGYLNCEIRFIKNLPIKLPETADEKRLAERIVESVRAIMDGKTKLRDAKLSDRERRTLEGDVENHEHRIDELIFNLYGVKELPN